MTKERNDGLRALLLRASIYEAAQRLIGGDRAMRRFAAQLIRSTPSSVVVDIGCGTAHLADFIDFEQYVGFDPNPPYVEEANRNLAARHGEKATAFEAGVGSVGLRERLPTEADVVVMAGVMHHIDDDLVHDALSLAAELVSGGGRLVTFDPGLVVGQPRIARALAMRDRGQHVRTPETTAALFRSHFRAIDVGVRTDYLRVPYTHIVVEASH